MVKGRDRVGQIKTCRIYGWGWVVKDSLPDHPAEFPRLLTTHKLSDRSRHRWTLVFIPSDLRSK